MNRRGAPPPEQACSIDELLAGAQAFLRLSGGQKPCDATLKAAWDQFFQMEDEHLRRLVAAQKQLPPDRQEDVAQEAWADVLKGLHGFQGAGAADKLHGWMAEVVHSKAVNLRRRLYRRWAESLDALSPESVGPTAGERAGSEELREFVEARLAADPTTCRLVLGRYWDGRSVKELAAEFGLTPGAASHRIRRAIQTLRRCLSDE